MAIGPHVFQKHEDLIAADKELKEMRLALAGESRQLETLTKQNEILQADVERWNRYQANLARLANLQGKFYWVEWLERRQSHDDLEEKYASRKGEISALKAEYARRQREQAPLRKVCEQSKEQKRLMTRLCETKNTQREKLREELESHDARIGDVRHGLRSVDKNKSEKTRKLHAQEKELADGEAQKETLEREVQHEFKKPVDEVVKAALQDVEDARAEKFSRESAHHETQEALHKAQREHERTEASLRGLADVQKQKMQIIMRNGPDVAHLANWVENSGDIAAGRDVLGPLMMHFDIPDQLQGQLAEQVLITRHVFGFVARTDSVKRALSAICREKRWNVNVYLFPHGFNPISRPSSAELAKFGVIGWLDEALQVSLTRFPRFPACHTCPMFPTRHARDTFVPGRGQGPRHGARRTQGAHGYRLLPAGHGEDQQVRRRAPVVPRKEGREQREDHHAEPDPLDLTIAAWAAGAHLDFSRNQAAAGALPRRLRPAAPEAEDTRARGRCRCTEPRAEPARRARAQD
tara:strand:- start:1450 stop:3021 length:1572 start_codon:yes stop_codon:yes gene_type:complete